MAELLDVGFLHNISLSKNNAWQHAGSTAHQREGTDVTLRVPCQDAKWDVGGGMGNGALCMVLLQKNIWLVVWNMFYFPFHIWDVILTG